MTVGGISNQISNCGAVFSRKAMRKLGLAEGDMVELCSPDRGTSIHRRTTVAARRQPALPDYVYIDQDAMKLLSVVLYDRILILPSPSTLEVP